MLSNFDFFRKVPRDFTEGTVPGSALSIVATVVMVALFFLELKSFLTVKIVTDIIMDPGSEDGNDLGINFKMSMPELVSALSARLARMTREHVGTKVLSWAWCVVKTGVPVREHRHLGHDGDRAPGHHEGHHDDTAELGRRVAGCH